MFFWKKKNKEEEKKKVEKEVVVETSEERKEVPVKGSDTKKKTNKDTTKKETPVSEEKATEKKATNKVYHVSLRKEDGKWQVKYGGGERAIKLFDTQAEAIEFAKKRAESQDGSISIHKKDGKIRKQNYSKKEEK